MLTQQATQVATQLAISQLQSRVAIPLFLRKEGDSAPAHKQRSGHATLELGNG